MSLVLNLFCWWCSVLAPFPTSSKVAVSVAVYSTAQARGSIRLGVFKDAAAFTQDESLASLVLPLAKNSPWPATLQLPALQPGTYALAAYQDLNNNGKLDRSLLGIPTEPYGFMRTPASKWRPPRWEEISFSLNQESGPVEIKLRDWQQY
ncbi:MAG: DUF2141 domain-containing protein [Lewinella sp.]|nr:DUF2141 domain-containing protein [Lewinella sp.]